MILLAGLLFGEQAFAAIVVTFEDKQKGVSYQTTMTLEGSHARIETYNVNTRHVQVIIFQADKKRVFHLNPQAHQYTEITQNGLEHARQEARQRLEAQMQKMSPEEQQQWRVMIQALTEQAGGQTSDVQHDIAFQLLGSRKSYGGFSCLPYRELQKGVAKSEGCFIPWGETGIRASDFSAFDTVGLGTQQQLVARFAHLPGMPAHIVGLNSDASISREQTLISIKQKAVPNDLFEVPADYHRAGTEREDGH